MSYHRKLRYEKIMDISMGEFRVFISVRNLVVGLPLENCRNRDAWIEENGHSKYLPIQKAKNMLRYALGNTSFRELSNNYAVRGLL
jgi:hypothetical protein